MQTKQPEKLRRNVARQPSIEEDAMYIRKAIEEVERGSSRFKHDNNADNDKHYNELNELDNKIASASKLINEKLNSVSNVKESRDSFEDSRDDNKKKDADKGNGKKKSKSRARLEREQSKPSESDTEPDIDTVTVEIPRRKKRPRRTSEKPRTPPASLHSDSEGEVGLIHFTA